MADPLQVRPHKKNGETRGRSKQEYVTVRYKSRHCTFLIPAREITRNDETSLQDRTHLRSVLDNDVVQIQAQHQRRDRFSPRVIYIGGMHGRSGPVSALAAYLPHVANVRTLHLYLTALMTDHVLSDILKPSVRFVWSILDSEMNPSRIALSARRSRIQDLSDPLINAA